jgi:ATP-binding cassette subfamily B (MDR/TAP) protein 1
MEPDKTENGDQVLDISIIDTEKAKDAPDAALEKPHEVKTAAPEREPSFKDYIRVFSYANKWDVVLMMAAAIASVGAGVTMPLMIVIFGRLAGSFNNYTGSSAQIQQEFNDTLNRQSLFMLALFLARFALNYINKAWPSQKLTGLPS